MSMYEPPTAAQVQQANAGVSQQINTPVDFAHALLGYMNLPDTPSNVQALVAWAAAEGGNWNNTARYNPFNTTLTMPGSSVMSGGNTAGVQQFTSWQQGVEATARTLQGYPTILSALRQGNDPMAVTNAVVQSRWGTGTIDLGAADAYGGKTGQFGAGVATTAGPGGLPPGQGQVDHPYDPNDPNVQSVSADDMTWVKQNAGQDLWMMADPELAKILAWVGHYQITDTAEVTSMVAQTNWYKQHSTAQRAWVQLYGSDPAEAARQIGSLDPKSPNYGGAMLQVHNMAGQLGITLTQDQLNNLAINANFHGWNQQEMQAAVSQYTSVTAPSANLASLQQDANTYLTPMSDQSLQQWLTNINAGTSTQQQFNAYLRQQAAGRFPWMAAQIQAGITPATILDPYAQSIGRTLEIDPSNINFNDPKWAQLTYTTDPKTGQQVQMPLWQSEQMVKQNPNYGYQYTVGGRNAAYDTAAQLTKVMGAVA